MVHFRIATPGSPWAVTRLFVEFPTHRAHLHSGYSLVYASENVQTRNIGLFTMARCEQGYLCDVCGQEVESIRESDLYLRFVIGELPSRHLLAAPERHLRCNPVNAQFIESPDFPPVVVEGDFDRRLFDAEFVRQRTQLVTRGWLRLQELAEQAQTVPLPEYPLEEFRTAGNAAR